MNQPELDGPTLTRAQRGHEDACRALIACYEQRVFAALASRLGERHPLIEAVAEETFAHALRTLAKLATLQTARLGPWLVSEAVRRADDARPAEQPAPADERPADFADRVLAARQRAAEHAPAPEPIEPWWQQLGSSRPVTLSAVIVAAACVLALLMALCQSSTLPEAAGPRDAADDTARR